MKRLLAAMTVCSLLLGACGNDREEPAAGPDSGTTEAADAAAATSPHAQLIAASEKTIAAKSAKIAMRLTMSGVPNMPAETYVVTADGAFDFGAMRGSLTMSLPPMNGQQLGPMTMVMDGSVIYQRLPDALVASAGGKPWIKIDLAQAASAAGIDLSSMLQAQGTDPAQALAFLKGASDDIVEVGTEELRGDQVTHYRLSIDMAKAADNVPPDQRDAVRQAAELYGAKPLPAEVWIDAEDRLRQMKLSIDLSQLALPAEARGQAQGRMETVVEYYDFGVPVTVSVPPADQVTDISALQQ